MVKFDVVTSFDYYPFGMLMPGRNGGSSYRYNFHGQESDDEIKGKGNSANYKYRMHDTRLGRFFAVDPLTSKYPQWTPYQFGGNQVILSSELEGLEPNVNLETTSTTTHIDAPMGPDEITKTLITGTTANPVKAIGNDPQPSWKEGTTVNIDGKSLSFHMGITNDAGETKGRGWYNTEDYINWAVNETSLGYSFGDFHKTYSGEYDDNMFASLAKIGGDIKFSAQQKEHLRGSGGIRKVDGPEVFIGPGTLKLTGKALSFLYKGGKSLLLRRTLTIGSDKMILEHSSRFVRDQNYFQLMVHGSKKSFLLIENRLVFL